MSETSFFKKNDVILRNGNPADCAYLILKGKVHVYLERNERIVTLAELEIGSLFGESALFEEGSEYGAHVKAVEDTEVAIISPEDFKEKIQGCDPMIQSIVRTLIERQRKTNEVLLHREAQEFIELDLVDTDSE